MMLLSHGEILCFPVVEAGGEGDGVEETEVEEEDAARKAFAVVCSVDEYACRRGNDAATCLDSGKRNVGGAGNVSLKKSVG